MLISSCTVATSVPRTVVHIFRHEHFTDSRHRSFLTPRGKKNASPRYPWHDPISCMGGAVGPSSPSHVCGGGHPIEKISLVTASRSLFLPCHRRSPAKFNEPHGVPQTVTYVNRIVTRDTAMTSSPVPICRFFYLSYETRREGKKASAHIRERLKALRE
jgi:hypothetical protein